MTAPVVVHCKRAPFDVYVGRGNGSTWGNPFTHKAGTLAEFVVPHAEVIPRYEAWLRAQPELVAKVRAELRGKELACWCAGAAGLTLARPYKCHAQVLAQVASEGL